MATLAVNGESYAVNAIFAATGARVRQVPLQPDRVLRAIQQKA